MNLINIIKEEYNNILKEVGDASAKSYDYKIEYYYNEDSIEYSFITDLNTKYEVGITEFHTQHFSKRGNTGISVDFIANDSLKIENKGEMYKVMATITNIIKKHVEHKKIDFIYFQTDNKRHKLYAEYLKKYFSKKIETDGNNIYYFLNKNILKEEDYKGEHEAPDRESGSPLHDVIDKFGKDFYNLSIDEIVRQFGSHNSYDRNVAYIIKSYQNKPNLKIKIYRAIPDFNKEVKDKIKDLSTIIDYYDKYRFFPPSYKNKKLNNIVYEYENKIKNSNPDIKYDDLQKEIYEYLWKDIIELRSKRQKYEINPGDWVTIIRDYAVQHGKNELRNYIILSKTVYADEIYTEGYLEEWGYDPRTNSKSLNEYLNESFFDKFKNKDIFKLTKNTWTHLTNSEELINSLINGNDFIGKKEDLTKFNISQKGSFATYINQYSPNFKKGGIFSGYEQHKFLITTELSDDAFQPNWNTKNYNNLSYSQNVGVLKPEFRDPKNFKLWKRNKNNQFELLK